MSFVIKQSTVNATQIRKSIDTLMPIKMTAEDALALKVQCHLSDDQYQIIRNSSMTHQADIYPSLHKILEAKQLCYRDNMIIFETSAEVPLQDMVNHTLCRIMEISPGLQSIQGVKQGVLYLKVGFDGASSQSIY